VLPCLPVSNAASLKTLDVSDGTRQMVIGVEASLEGLGMILQQEHENTDQHA